MLCPQQVLGVFCMAGRRCAHALRQRPHPSVLRTATFPKGEGFIALRGGLWDGSNQTPVTLPLWGRDRNLPPPVAETGRRSVGNLSLPLWGRWRGGTPRRMRSPPQRTALARLCEFPGGSAAGETNEIPAAADNAHTTMRVFAEYRMPKARQGRLWAEQLYCVEQSVPFFDKETAAQAPLFS